MTLVPGPHDHASVTLVSPASGIVMVVSVRRTADPETVACAASATAVIVRPARLGGLVMVLPTEAALNAPTPAVFVTVFPVPPLPLSTVHIGLIVMRWFWQSTPIEPTLPVTPFVPVSFTNPRTRI